MDIARSRGVCWTGVPIWRYATINGDNEKDKVPRLNIGATEGVIIDDDNNGAGTSTRIGTAASLPVFKSVNTPGWSLHREQR